MILIIILICLCVTFGVYIFHTWLQLRPYNQAPLDIKTFDGSDSPYHPSVLYFKDGWNGYKYWMAETPFSPQCKPYMDRNECPSIHVSNNGVDWEEIAKNPIDDLHEKEIKELDYFSDPHLVYVKGKLECWYRFTHRSGDNNYYDNLQLVRKTSYDGINWSDREILVNLATAEGNELGNMVVSPAIIYSNGRYRMWYVDSESRGQRGLAYSESEDGRKWQNKSACRLIGAQNNPWHIDVNFIDGIYYLISYDSNNLTIWKSEDGQKFHYIKELLSPSVTGSFYGDSLYRACIIKDEKLKVFFSAKDLFRTYIGLLEGENIPQIKVVQNGQHTTLYRFAIFIINKKKKSLQFIAKRIYRLIKLK